MNSKNLFNIRNENSFTNSMEIIQLILDHITEPSILLDTKQSEILGINLYVTQLTGYGRNDLIGTKVQSFIVDFPETEIIEGKKLNGYLHAKGKADIPIQYRLYHLNIRSHLAFIKINTKDVNGEAQTSINTRFNTGLEKLGWTTLAEGKAVFYQSVIDEAAAIFNSKDSILYVKDNETSDLRKINESEKIFPNSIPYTEIERLKNIDCWNPGKRVLTEIHRAGRRGSLANVVSIPMGSDPVGLLVITSEDRKFFDKQKKHIRAFSNWLNLYLKQKTKFIELMEKNASLIKSNNINSILIDQSTDSMVILDEHLKIIGFNETFLQKFKYASFEVIGQKVSDFIQNNTIISLVEDQNNDDPSGKGPVEVIDRDGKSFFIKVRKIELGEGENREILLILSDSTSEIVTKRKFRKIEEQAELGNEIAKFAHEVRNPINNLSTGLQLMRKMNTDNSSSLDVIDRLQEDCIRMNDLMESLLTYSKLDIVNFKKVDIKLLAERLIRRFQNKLNKSGIKSSISYDAPNPLVIGDLRALERIFTNLINNSIDSMKNDGGEISIVINCSEKEPSDIEITIADTGHGIPEKIKERMFVPFTTSKEQGTGLGLSITKKLIDAHGGKIFVDSFTSGTIFKVQLKTAIQEK